MKALLDRHNELQELETSWATASRGQAQLVVLWGRRRVGKTYLLSHFVRDKRAVFFGATQQAEAVELARLHEAVRRGLGNRTVDLAGGGFTSWEAALRYLAALAKSEPLAIVIDEVPYLLRSTPGFASIVQVVWDHLKRGTRLLLVLTGSAVSVVEDLIGADGPLRGRPNLSRRLDPLDPIAAREFLPRLADADFLEAYAACGGYPLHLRAWDSSSSLEVNLSRLAYSSGGLLLQDAASMLAEELSDTAGHARILAAVGRGHTRYGEIANEAGQRVEAPIETLVRGGFLRKLLPVGAPKAARPHYEIADPYLSFWFSCLFANTTEIEAGQGSALSKRTRPIWQRHMGTVFEELARAHAARLVVSGDLPGDLVIGRWWASRGEQVEVDVLGLLGSRTALLGEARWQEDPLDLRTLDALKQKVRLVPQPVPDPTFCLWARSGVAPSVKRAGAKGYGLRQMLGR
jgi:AAA+ ATPase superfamily predicted ATPase